MVSVREKSSVGRAQRLATKNRITAKLRVKSNRKTEQLPVWAIRGRAAGSRVWFLVPLP